jgi:hypothetical protein
MMPTTPPDILTAASMPVATGNLILALSNNLALPFGGAGAAARSS